ncbi:MAG: amidohydrolase family protein [Myxococcota bacterium]
MSYPMISADGHIDLPCLPEHLFVEGAPEALKERMPRVIEKGGERVWVSSRGQRLGLAGGMGSAGREYVPGEIHRADRMAETGLYEDQRRGILRPSVPELRIADQERDGVLGEVLYGILGAANRLEDPDVTEAVVRIYNDFLAGFCAKAPERFAGIACLPPRSPEEAGREVRRAAGLGLRGVELSMAHDMTPLWHADWEPMWEAAADCGIPVHVHTIGPKVDARWIRDRTTYRPWLATHITGFQVTMSATIAAIIFGGALERHSDLRVVIGEAGIGWMPYLLERMDYEWEDQFKDLPLRMKPSEYWRRQMFATFQVDEVGIANLDRMGAETVMWGSDFPHPDGIWPDSREIVDRQLRDVSPETRHKLVYENAARLYGFPLEPRTQA